MKTPALGKLLCICLISLFFSLPATAQITIDDFDDEHETPAMTKNIATDSAILGGEREVDNSNNALGTLNGNSELVTTLGFFNSVRLVYDGADGDTEVFDHEGLGGLDLASTSDALLINGAQSLQFSVTIDIAIYTSEGNSSFARQNLGSFLEPANLIVPFTSFEILEGDGADFSNVGAIEIVISGNGDTFFYVNSFGFNDTPLPVELTSFTALEDGKDVVLAWETASELNNAGFSVEYQPSGADTFEALAFVEGNGTTQDAQRYAYTVSSLPSGEYQFRLKQIDFDGTFAYSPLITATVHLNSAYTLSAAYPNPFNPSSTFSLVVNRDQDVQISLYDMTGREVSHMYSGSITANQTMQFTIDGSYLPSGNYLYRVNGDYFQASGQVLLVK